MSVHPDAEDRNFDRLVRAHRARVRAYLARRLPPNAVDDVLADVLLVAWRRRSEVPGEPLPWLLGVASKTLSTRWRSEARRDALVARLAEQPPAPGPSLEDDVRRRAQQRALAAALGALGESDRELVLLRFWDDLRPREIAVVLATSPVAVRARLHRATVRLHRYLRAELAGAADPSSPAEPAAVPLPLPTR